jgi:hypothetical protein
MYFLLQVNLAADSFAEAPAGNSDFSRSTTYRSLRYGLRVLLRITGSSERL